MRTVATPAARAWQAERGRLIGIAYRMLGDLGHAEDVVSEVAIEALRRERDGDVRSWPAWLTTVSVRRSIDRVRSLAAEREEYVGHWLPEPVATSRLPEDAIADRELLSVALLHLAEQLSPEARAAVVLHRAFGMSAGEIGDILGKSPAAVRQLVSRGERRLQLTPAGAEPSPSWSRGAAALAAAIGQGDLDAVLELLRDDAVLWSDGGGRVRAALNPVFGAERVRRFFRGIRSKLGRTQPGLPFHAAPADVNGEPAIALTHSGRTDIVAFEVDDEGLVRGVRLVSNPEKLGHAF